MNLFTNCIDADRTHTLRLQGKSWGDFQWAMRIGVMSYEQIKFFEFLSLQRRAVLKCADCSGCFDEPMTACLGQTGSKVEFSSLVWVKYIAHVRYVGGSLCTIHNILVQTTVIWTVLSETSLSYTNQEYGISSHTINDTTYMIYATFFFTLTSNISLLHNWLLLIHLSFF